MANYNFKYLDEAVLDALTFFNKKKPTKLDLKKINMPIVVGSGNAYNAGLIIFKDKNALFATESNFAAMLKNYKPLIKNGLIKEAVVISASGEKDSVWEVKAAKKAGLKTILMTCVADSSAAKIADSVIAYRKLAEPYTYNTSTYLGMILSATGENPLAIKNFLKKINLPRRFKKYSAYSFVLPDEYGAIAPMLDIKRHELFGPKMSLRAFSSGEARHAKFVIRDDKELVISFGENKFFGSPKSRLEIKLPKTANSGLVMALSYYVIGFMQRSKPSYFMKNIERYCTDDGYKAYGSTKPFDVIVPGN
ncbi:MAG: hypothetical protein WAW11_03885 [Patescibacteria group bacterium]